jgi:hypothetical protein
MSTSNTRLLYAERVYGGAHRSLCPGNLTQRLAKVGGVLPVEVHLRVRARPVPVALRAYARLVWDRFGRVALAFSASGSHEHPRLVQEERNLRT